MASETSEKRVPLNTVLLEAREAQGISLESVAGQLKLSVVQLKKLEKEGLNPETLTTFERGYVRNYATFLGLDLECIERYFSGYDYGYSALHSVKVYGETEHKPLLGRFIIKWLLVFVLIGLVGALIWSAFPSLLNF